jgi:hypothetical protein
VYPIEHVLPAQNLLNRPNDSFDDPSLADIDLLRQPAGRSGGFWPSSGSTTISNLLES